MAESLNFTVAEGGGRLDLFLVGRSNLSRTQIQHLIDEGHITVNAKRVKPGARLSVGDAVEAALAPPPVPKLVPQAMPLDVLYEDGDVLVINKPPYLTVHPAPGHPDRTLANALLAFRPELAAQGGTMRPGIVHRLDKDTSGVMVIAKHQEALQHLARELKERRFVKKYLALVDGLLTPPRGLIDAPIARDPSHRQRMAVVADGRESYTKYRVLQTYGEQTLVEAELVTGRTHQIRVHFAAIGFPVVGDTLYGKPSPLVRRQFLHAQTLGFRLPSTNEQIELSVPLPDDLQAALDRLDALSLEMEGAGAP